MKFSTRLCLSVLVICAGVAFAHPPEYSDADIAKQLYDSVIIGAYDDAVTTAIDLDKNNKGAVVSDAVNRLINDQKRNTMDYVYQLWKNNGEEVVKKYFPVQFRQIVNEHLVKIINKKYNQALKLASAKDDMNDRLAYGDATDKTTDNVNWRFVPVWSDNRVYFKIVNVKRSQNLKLIVKTDSMGEHRAYGDDAADTNRHLWYILPVKYENNLLFNIYNREYDHPLKLDTSKDDAGDRLVWGHKGNVNEDPERFGWEIEPF